METAAADDERHGCASVRMSAGGATSAAVASGSAVAAEELMDGLTLFKGMLDDARQAELLEFIEDLLARGRRGALCGLTYKPPPDEWRRIGKGRETLQFGVRVHCNKVDLASTEPLPAELHALLDDLTTAGIFAIHERPDTCCVNIYETGSWLPPHVDSEAFARPFCTLSLISAQEALFGEDIDGDAGSWHGDERAVRVLMPPGSVLRVGGYAAGPLCKHALPMASGRRISLTFRRLGAATRAHIQTVRDQAAAAAEARRQRRREKKEARGRHPLSLAGVSRAVPTVATTLADTAALGHEGGAASGASGAAAQCSIR